MGDGDRDQLGGQQVCRAAAKAHFAHMGEEPVAGHEVDGTGGVVQGHPFVVHQEAERRAVASGVTERERYPRHFLGRLFGESRFIEED